MYHLQPEVYKLKSYTKDSTDMVNKLAKIMDEITEDNILVTMDIHSLYTNIPNDEGIQTKQFTIENILTHNNFIFDGVNYLQTLGCAMGTICAPSYANIFMGMFEETQIYPRIINNIHNVCIN